MVRLGRPQVAQAVLGDRRRARPEVGGPGRVAVVLGALRLIGEEIAQLGGPHLGVEHADERLHRLGVARLLGEVLAQPLDRTRRLIERDVQRGGRQAEVDAAPRVSRGRHLPVAKREQLPGAAERSVRRDQAFAGLLVVGVVVEQREEERMARS